MHAWGSEHGTYLPGTEGLFGMKYFYRNFKGLPNLYFADVTYRLERRNETFHSSGKVSFTRQNTRILTSTLGQSFRARPRRSRAR